MRGAVILSSPPALLAHHRRVSTIAPRTFWIEILSGKSNIRGLTLPNCVLAFLRSEYNHSAQTSTLPVNLPSVQNVLQEGGEEMKIEFQQIKVGALSLTFAALMCASTAIANAQDTKPEMTRPEPASPPSMQPSSPPPAPPPSAPAPAPSTPSEPNRSNDSGSRSNDSGSRSNDSGSRN